MSGSLGDLSKLLENCISVEHLSRRELWRYQQRWRECYCATVKAKTGKWTTGKRDWYTFLEGYSRCLVEGKALHAFLACPADDFLVISKRAPAVRCAATAMPHLELWCGELYVFPPDLSWTMVFTPDGWFFSRREWQPYKSVS